MADMTALVNRLKARITDEDFPYTDGEYQTEIESALAFFGYEANELPKSLDSLVVQKAQVNLLFDLAAKHARYHRVRIEGDIEIHRQHVAENYLKTAMALDENLSKAMNHADGIIEVVDASRWRVSDNRNVSKPDGSGY